MKINTAMLIILGIKTVIKGIAKNAAGREALAIGYFIRSNKNVPAQVKLKLMMLDTTAMMNCWIKSSFIPFRVITT